MAVSTEFRFPIDDPVDLNLFPDGLRTTGQNPPLYELIRPFSDFPKKIEGVTAWDKEDYSGENEKKWKRPFSPEEIEELSEAAENYLASGRPLTAMCKEYFPLPKREKALQELRDDLLNGKGFVLFQGLPVKEWGIQKSAIAYMGMGSHLGYIISQNGKGHLLGHVKDLGEDPKDWHYVRFYRTNARQPFHADPSDIVGLLVLQTALEGGGEVDIVSGHTVWNTLQKEDPDVLKTLVTPDWYFDRKGETCTGSEDYIRSAVFFMEKDNSRLYGKYDTNFVRSLKRYWDKGVLPEITPEQHRAMDVFEETCQRHSIHLKFEVGDVNFINNTSLFHARSGYRNAPPPAPQRHLLRLWLSTPESEGGWKLPFHDSDAKKRGGVQVDNVPPKVLFHAE